MSNKAESEFCIYPNGCAVTHLLDTNKELKKIAKRTYQNFIKEPDDQLAVTLGLSQEHVDDLRDSNQQRINSIACEYCPHKK